MNRAVTTTATKPIAGNPAGANNANSGVVRAVQAPATKPINANDSAARGTVSSFGAWVSGLTYFVSVIANKIGFAGGGIMPNAEGNILPNAQGNVIPMARGGNKQPTTFGKHRLTPMGTRASIVGANTWRVVGDRATGDEAYIPLTNSPRSKAILSTAADRMGYQILPTDVASAIGAAADMRNRVMTATAASAAAPTIKRQGRRLPAASRDALGAQRAALRRGHGRAFPGRGDGDPHPVRPARRGVLRGC